MFHRKKLTQNIITSALIFDLRVSLLGWDQAPCSIKTIIRRRFSEQNASKDTEFALTDDVASYNSQACLGHAAVAIFVHVGDFG